MGALIENLSVVVLTLNEASRMPRCISSLASFASRVVIIDSFSNDSTLEVAKKCWLQSGRLANDLILVTQAWRGFTKTRNDSLEWVRTPWVLWIDADEWVDEVLIEELKALLSKNHADLASVYKIPRLSIFLGRAIRHGGWYPDRKARLAKVDFCEWRSGPNQADVHEDLYPKNSISSRPSLKNHLFHEGFRSTQEQEETNERYSSLLAQGLAERYKTQGLAPPSDLFIAFKMLVKFVENYLWKLGFLDGYPGYLIARGSSKSLGLRYKKMRKLLNA